MIWSPFRWFARYLGTFLTAFILALIVWVLAVINADPNISCPAPTSIPLDIIGQDTSLLLIEDNIPDNVEIQLRAPRSVCERLAQESGAVLASVDLSTLREGDHTLEVRPQISEEYRPVRIIETSPSQVRFTLELFELRILPLRFNITGEPAPGFKRGTMIVSDSLVTVSGRKSLVDQVSEAVVTLDMTDAQTDIEAERSIVLLDAEGDPISSLKIEPAMVTIQQMIERPSTYREVTVKVVTTGQPADGYRLTNITAFPQVVTVFSSNPQLVREMPGFVETNPISLTDATDDIERRVSLVLPEGVSVAGEQSVLVQISIAALESSQPLSLVLEVIGLSPGLQATLAPELVDLIISGPLPVLDTIQPGDIRVFLDLTGLESGQYTIEPRVEILLPNVIADSVLPSTVEVIISILPTLTLTPTLDPSMTLTPENPSLTPVPTVTPTQTSSP